MRSLVISSSKERRTSVPSGEMVEEEMEKRWGSLARGRKASLPVLTSYKRLSRISMTTGTASTSLFFRL